MATLPVGFVEEAKPPEGFTEMEPDNPRKPQGASNMDEVITRAIQPYLTPGNALTAGEIGAAMYAPGILAPAVIVGVGETIRGLAHKKPLGEAAGEGALMGGLTMGMGAAGRYVPRIVGGLSKAILRLPKFVFNVAEKDPEVFTKEQKPIVEIGHKIKDALKVFD